MTEIIDSTLLSPSEQWLIATTVSYWTQEAQIRHEAVLPKNPSELFTQMQLGLTAIAFLHSEPVGHITAWHLAQNSYETGTLFVKLDVRNHQIGKKLIVYHAGNHPDKILKATTKNPFARDAFLASGYQLGEYQQVQPLIRQGLCYDAPCFVAGHSSSFCKHEQNNTCYLLIKNSKYAS